MSLVRGHGGCVLDLEQYRIRGRTPGAPILGHTSDTDVSLFTMSKSRPTGRSNPCAHGLDDRVVGGAYRDRTDDLLNANQALSQLSYGPILSLGRLIALWWARVDLNHRPHAYQACALTS